MKKLTLLNIALLSCISFTSNTQAMPLFAEKWIDPTGERQPVFLLGDRHFINEREPDVMLPLATQLADIFQGIDCYIVLETPPSIEIHEKIKRICETRDHASAVLKELSQLLVEREAPVVHIEARELELLIAYVINDPLVKNEEDELTDETELTDEEKLQRKELLEMLDSEITLGQLFNAPLECSAKHNLPLYSGKNKEYFRDKKDGYVQRYATKHISDQLERALENDTLTQEQFDATNRDELMPVFIKHLYDLTCHSFLTINFPLFQFFIKRVLPLIYDEVVEAVALGHIERHFEKPTIVMLGGAHIVNMEEGLTQMGYEKAEILNRQNRVGVKYSALASQHSDEDEARRVFGEPGEPLGLEEGFLVLLGEGTIQAQALEVDEIAAFLLGNATA